MATSFPPTDVLKFVHSSGEGQQESEGMQRHSDEGCAAPSRIREQEIKIKLNMSPQPNGKPVQIQALLQH